MYIMPDLSPTFAPKESLKHGSLVQESKLLVHAGKVRRND